MNNSHRLLFIVYYFEYPHSFVDKLSSVTFFLLISSRAFFINIDSICTAELRPCECLIIRQLQRLVRYYLLRNE